MNEIKESKQRQNFYDLFESRISKTVKKNSHTHLIKRIEVAIEPLNILDWFNLQKADQAVYWQNREHDFEIAGVHTCYQIKSVSNRLEESLLKIEEVLQQSDDKVLFYGGTAFTGYNNNTDDWSTVSEVMFFVPQIEIVRRGDKYFAALNQFIADDSSSLFDVLESVEIISNYVKVHNSNNTIINRIDTPDYKNFKEILLEATSQIKQHELEKVVLARQVSLTFEATVDALAILSKLENKEENSTLFYFQYNKSQVFLGRTPELLFKKNGKLIESEAIAGNRSVMQENLDSELLHSKKDGHEHHLVVLAIREILQSWPGKLIESEKVEILKLENVQHLYKTFQLIGDTMPSLFEVMQKFHPTPALGGVPKTRALEFLQEHEPFNRGWYGAPVGCISKEGAEFAVAIRSALIHDNKVELYSGCGVVESSQPELEWQELELKLKNFLNIVE